MRNNYSALLGTPLIQGDTNHSKPLSRFWVIWLIAVAISIPAGIITGKVIGSTRMQQVQECMAKIRDHHICAEKYLQ